MTRCGIERERAEKGKKTSEDQPINPVHDAAMPWNEMARILDPEPALDERFEEIADLRKDRQQRGDHHMTKSQIESSDDNDDAAGDDSRNGSANRARPGLARRDGRRELRPTNCPPDEIGKDVGCPDDGK